MNLYDWFFKTTTANDLWQFVNYLLFDVFIFIICICGLITLKNNIFGLVLAMQLVCIFLSCKAMDAKRETIKLDYEIDTLKESIKDISENSYQTGYDNIGDKINDKKGDLKKYEGKLHNFFLIINALNIINMVVVGIVLII